jgi:hypothetical protein
MELKEALEILKKYMMWVDGDSGQCPIVEDFESSINTVLQWHKDNEVKPKEPIEAVSGPQNLQSQIKLSEPITIASQWIDSNNHGDTVLTTSYNGERVWAEPITIEAGNTYSTINTDNSKK